MTEPRPETSPEYRPEPQASTAASGPSAASGSADRRARDRRLVLAVTVWVPLTIIAVGAGILMTWLPRTPDPMVTHWGADGEPNGWMSPAGNLIAYLVISLGVLVVMAGAAWLSTRVAAKAQAELPDSGRPDAGQTDTEQANPWRSARSAALFAPAVTTAVTIVFVALTGVQLDGSEPADWVVPVIVAVGLGLGALVGVVTSFVLPAPEPGEHTSAETIAHALRAAVRLAPGERAVWTAVARAPWPVTALLVLALLLTLVPVALDPSLWAFSLVFLVVVAVLATTTAARITVDTTGLRVRTLLGLPIGRVRLDQVVVARAVDVRPSEFGGWGFRFDARGRRGIILRGGSAIEIERIGAQPFVVTVPDAENGAALLNGLVAEARGTN
ncbi:putative membrane protein [Agromyces terreus]|uniref:Membrane protein n=1 Tax=Agromyces terreus TaxID=424795 RepID=A0A9X2GVV0_9MICO|nr:DUF1648 domain-containing protein [Agromyces terreus]MCP2369577.1 putative membrane protein [Agromyces terreus]